MKHIGLIETEDSTYRFNAYLDKENRCKSYRYYYENEVLFKDYCIVNNIDKKVVVNTYNSTKTQIPNLELFDNNAGVRIASNLYLKKPINYSKDDFERHLNYVLHQNYPDLEYYEMLADYINQTYYADDVDLQIKYQPNFTWNNKNKGNNNVHKIGIRATNSLVSASKKNDSRTYIIRDDVKRTYKLHLEYDVSSSVPRLTLSINLGRWVSEEEIPDIYYCIYKKYEEIRREKYINTYNSTKTHFEPMEYNRNAIKKLFMWIYFDDTSDINIGSHVRNNMNDKSDKSGVYEQVAILKQAARDVLGDFDHSEIFYHESNIYMEVTLELLNRGYFIWQVYDSWYARKAGVTQEEYEKEVKELVEEKAKLYIKHERE